jgi:hypothetical protein
MEVNMRYPVTHTMEEVYLHHKKSLYISPAKSLDNVVVIYEPAN